jgi:hypothetical protein
LRKRWALPWALVERPAADIDGCREAHARLATAIDKVSDSVARLPTLLPEWSVGHVITHLARNAEAMVRRVEAATRGEVIDQYAGGVEGRALEIEAGAGRPARELIADVLFWSQQLDGTFDLLPDDCWGRPVRSMRGGEHPVSQLPRHRWWEVEVHPGRSRNRLRSCRLAHGLRRLGAAPTDHRSRRSGRSSLADGMAPWQRFATHARRALGLTPPPNAGWVTPRGRPTGVMSARWPG